MRHEKDLIHFNNFLESIRKERGITTEQLCRGLCSVTQMHYIQCGERLPDYLTRNRIMARLGISSEGYEDYIHYDEYERWRQRQELIILIEDSNWDEAEKLLDLLKKNWKKTNKIEQQFLLDMQARIVRYKGGTDDQLSELYNEAVLQTIAISDSFELDNIVLSHVEYYYLMHYLYYKYRSNKEDKKTVLQKIEFIIFQIDKSKMVEIAKAKILPLAVIIYYLINENDEKQNKKIWYFTEVALDILKKTERLYYFEELIRIRQKIGSRDEFLERKTLDVIDDVRIIFGINKIEMWQNGYIYRDSVVCSIPKVIHDRRRMLGITRKKLPDGICSVRTLERIEANHSKPQQYVMKALFEKMFLIGEYRRSEIITDDVELFDLYNDYKKLVNQRDIDGAKRAINDIIERIDVNYIANRQAVVRMKNNICRYEKIEFSIDNYLVNLNDAIKLSLPVDIKESKQWYLTNAEMVLIYNIATRTSDNNDFAEVLDAICDSYDYYNNYSLKELIEDWKASQLGNAGLLAKSTNISINILMDSFRLCKAHGIYRASANIAWNNYENSNKDKNAKEAFNLSINNVINICDFYNNKLSDYYRKSLK